MVNFLIVSRGLMVPGNIEMVIEILDSTCSNCQTKYDKQDNQTSLSLIHLFRCLNSLGVILQKQAEKLKSREMKEG